MIVIKPGKLRDSMMLFVLFLGLGLMKIVNICTGKPDYVDYIKNKLSKRFQTKIISVDKDLVRVSFFLNDSQNLTKLDKIYTAKDFGLTLRNMKIIRVNQNIIKIVFLPKGIQIIKNFIQTFPNYYEQLTGRKTVLDIESEMPVLLTKEQKINIRNERKFVRNIIGDVIDYLMYVPVVGYSIRQLYWHRDIIHKITNKFPKNTNDFVQYFYMFLAIFVILFFAYTFKFWATFICLLVAGYGIRKIRRDIKIKELLEY